MNTRTLLSLLALSTLITQLSTPARAQGSLVPPAGPPVASMKTLDQVEARTPLVAGAPGVAISAAGTITISQPGSYYLTKNVTITTNVNGLEINADATVDLNGFSIIGTAAAITTGDAIALGASVNATVRNGFIKGGTTIAADGTYSMSGFRTGLYAGDLPANVRTAVTVTDLHIAGVRAAGIRLRTSSMVDRCIVQGAGGNGMDLLAWASPDSPSSDVRHYAHVVNSRAGHCGGQYGIAASRVSGSFGHTTLAASSFQSAPCGIVARQVEYSTGWATGTVILGVPNAMLFGIYGVTVSYSSGRATYVGSNLNVSAIKADTAIACTYEGAGAISAQQKHLGTP